LFSSIGTGPYTIVAVLRRMAGSTAHPFNVGGTLARFGATAWVESVGVNSAMTLSAPPPAWTAEEPVLWCAERSASGFVAFRVGSLDVAAGGTHHISDASVVDAAWTSVAPVTVGSQGAAGGLLLAAAIVWRGAVLSTAQRTALAAWWTGRWGLALPRLPVTTFTITQSDDATVTGALSATTVTLTDTDNVITMSTSGVYEADLDADFNAGALKPLPVRPRPDPCMARVIIPLAIAAQPDNQAVWLQLYVLPPGFPCRTNPSG
jgi:hypothetical protein